METKATDPIYCGLKVVLDWWFLQFCSSLRSFSSHFSAMAAEERSLLGDTSADNLNLYVPDWTCRAEKSQLRTVGTKFKHFTVRHWLRLAIACTALLLVYVSAISY